MSGVEAAGLILAAVPLIISGLEHYGEGVNTIRQIRHSSREFATLRRRLGVENGIFLNSLELLLKDDVDEVILARMIADVSDKSLWTNPSIDKCLRRCLGRTYDVYFDAVRNMSDSVRELKDSLQIGDDGKGPFAAGDKWSVSNGLKRLRFGIRMKAYEKMVDSITADRERISDLVTQNTALEPIRESRRRAPDFEKAQSYACSIYTTLRDRLMSSCNVDHSASVYMRPIDASTPGTGIKRWDMTSLRVVLHHDPEVISQASASWLIEEAEIRLLEEEAADRLIPVVPNKNLRFQELTSDLATAGQPDQPQPAEINDLCKSLHQLRSEKFQYDKCLGFMADSSRRSRHGLFWPRKPLVVQDSTPTLTLSHILDGQKRFVLGLTDKMYLALGLAMGVLRLYHTPWLSPQWGRRDVVLFQSQGSIVASHPFVSASLRASYCQEPRTTSNQATLSQTASQRTITPASAPHFSTCSLIKNDTIFALGVLLIEVCMERPLHDLSSPKDLLPDGSRYELSDYLTAEGLIATVRERAGDRYGDVVSRCIRCEFDQRNNSLENAAFRKAVYDGVVSVLEAEVDDILHL